MKIFQRIVLALGAVITVGLLFSSQNATQTEIKSIEKSFQSNSSAADDALTSFDLNSAGTDTVYQQQVVALWAVKDLLKVVADEQTSTNAIGEAVVQSNIAQANAQNTTNWLLGGVIIALCFLGFTRATGTKKANRRAERSASETDPVDVFLSH